MNIWDDIVFLKVLFRIISEKKKQKIMQIQTFF